MADDKEEMKHLDLSDHSVISHSFKQEYFTRPAIYETTDKTIDYLQDPSLWRDNLPQPYRLLNEILNDVLSKVFLLIQNKEMELEYERKNKKKIPKTDEGTLLSSLTGSTRLEYVKLQEREFLLAGGGPEGIVFVDLNENKHYSTPVGGPVNSISVQALSDNEHILLAIGMGKDGGLILIYDRNGTFNKINELEGLDCILNVLLSRDGTYLTVTGSNTNNEGSGGENKSVVRVCLYSLPTESWLQQLQSEQDNFTKPNLMYTISPPLLNTFSSANDATQAMKLIPDHQSGLPTGTNHGLTKTYLECRRNRFVSRRKGFISEDSELSYSLLREDGADVLFIHYWKREHFIVPKVLAIKWNSSTSLHFYVIPEKSSKITTLTVPDQVYHQPSLITSTIVSCSSFLAAGTCEGIVSLNDLSTNIFWGVVNIGSPLTALCFVQSTSDSVVMVGGREDGRVMCIKWNKPSNYSITSLTRGYDVPKPVHELKCNTTLPSTVISLHGNQCLIIWDWMDCVPLVTLCLPHYYSLLSNPKGTLVTGSDIVALIASHNEQIGVFSWQLSTCEALRKTCLKKDEFIKTTSPPDNSTLCDQLTNMITQIII